MERRVREEKTEGKKMYRERAEMFEMVRFESLTGLCCVSENL